MTVKDIAGQIQSGDFSLSDEEYAEHKNDYLAFVITLVEYSTARQINLIESRL